MPQEEPTKAPEPRAPRRAPRKRQKGTQRAPRQPPSPGHTIEHSLTAKSACSFPRGGSAATPGPAGSSVDGCTFGSAQEAEDPFGYAYGSSPLASPEARERCGSCTFGSAQGARLSLAYGNIPLDPPGAKKLATASFFCQALQVITRLQLNCMAEAKQTLQMNSTST